MSFYDLFVFFVKHLCNRHILRIRAMVRKILVVALLPANVQCELGASYLFPSILNIGLV